MCYRLRRRLEEAGSASWGREIFEIQGGPGAFEFGTQSAELTKPSGRPELRPAFPAVPLNSG
jgi:hypothetical protein